MKIETAMLQGGPSTPSYILCGNDSLKRRLTLRSYDTFGKTIP